MPSGAFLRSFRLLIAATWAIPPVFGLGFLVLVVELFDFAQLGRMMLSPPLPLYIVLAQVGTDLYFSRFARPIVAWLEQPTDRSREEAALARARRFPAHFWCLFLSYLLLAPAFVMWSAWLGYGFTPRPVDWFRLELVSLVVSIIVGLPIFLLAIDLFGRAFSPVDLTAPHVSLGAKIFLVGALVPLLIDTMLVQYYWTETGYFSGTTFAVWLVLELLAVAGALLAVRSFRQSVQPLSDLVQHTVDPAGVDITRLRPQSTDELGVVSARYRALLARLHDQNDRLLVRNGLLRQSRDSRGLLDIAEVVREATESALQASHVVVGLCDEDRLQVIARSGAPPGREEPESLPALVEVDPSAPSWLVEEPATRDLLPPGLRGPDLPLLLAPLRDRGEVFGVLAVSGFKGATRVTAVRARFEEIGLEAATLLAAARAQEHHEDAQARYQELTRFAPDAIVVLDGAFSIRSANEAAQRMLGSNAARDASSLASFFPEGPPRLAVEAKLKNVLERGTVTFEGTVQAPSGSLPVEVRARRLPTESLQIMALLRDISDRRALEQQVLHAQRMEGVGRLAGGVAHDFNNLLTVIVGCATLMKAEPQSGAFREEIDDILETASRAAELTGQLLTFSRLRVTAPQVLELNGAIAGMHKLLTRLVTSSIELELDLAEAPLHVFMDRTQWEQVLVNLVVNARDAVGDRGRVVVRTRALRVDDDDDLPAGDWAVLEVQDSGPGIPSHLLKDIFEPYFTTKEAGKGTGLGLSTVYGIATQAGGRVRAHSAPDSPTCFSVFLPRSLEASAPPEPRPFEVPRPAPGEAKILLLEDDPMLARMIQRALETAGLRGVRLVDRGDAALALLEDPSLAFDLLVSDVVVPGLRGTEVARRAREARPGVGVLLMSGYADAGAVEEIVRSGFPFLAKPFTPTELLARIRAVLGWDGGEDAETDRGA